MTNIDQLNGQSIENSNTLALSSFVSQYNKDYPTSFLTNRAKGKSETDISSVISTLNAYDGQNNEKKDQNFSLKVLFGGEALNENTTKLALPLDQIINYVNDVQNINELQKLETTIARLKSQQEMSGSSPNLFQTLFSNLSLPEESKDLLTDSLTHLQQKYQSYVTSFSKAGAHASTLAMATIIYEVNNPKAVIDVKSLLASLPSANDIKNTNLLDIAQKMNEKSFAALSAPSTLTQQFDPKTLIEKLPAYITEEKSLSKQVNKGLKVANESLLGLGTVLKQLFADTSDEGIGGIIKNYVKQFFTSTDPDHQFFKMIISGLGITEADLGILSDEKIKELANGSLFLSLSKIASLPKKDEYTLLPVDYRSSLVAPDPANPGKESYEMKDATHTLSKESAVFLSKIHPKGKNLTQQSFVEILESVFGKGSDLKVGQTTFEKFVTETNAKKQNTLPPFAVKEDSTRKLDGKAIDTAILAFKTYSDWQAKNTEKDFTAYLAETYKVQPQA